MFSKIIGKIKVSEDDVVKERLLEKISKMEIVDMRNYINGKLTDYKVSEYGLLEILNKITLKNESTSNLYIKEDDMDSKKKRVFDLVLLVLSSKQVTLSVLDSAQVFISTYSDIIKKYDKDNRQIYEIKMKEAISLAADKISFKSDVKNTMRTLS